MANIKNFAEVIRQKLKSNPELATGVEEARFKANIADEIYNARIQSGMSQTDLAELTGMKQSAIARLEDADYGKHSITSLRRIATALGKRLEIKFTNTYVNKAPLICDQINFQVDTPSNWQSTNDIWYEQKNINTKLTVKIK
jgi:transcriptional regulator with XRE-family HTH domain